MWKMFPEALNVNGARLRTCPVHWQTTKVLGSSNTQPSARFKPLADELSIWVTVLDHVRQVLVRRNFLFKLVGPLNPGRLTAISKLGNLFSEETTVIPLLLTGPSAAVTDAEKHPEAQSAALHSFNL